LRERANRERERERYLHDEITMAPPQDETTTTRESYHNSTTTRSGYHCDEAATTTRPSRHYYDLYARFREICDHHHDTTHSVKRSFNFRNAY